MNHLKLAEQYAGELEKMKPGKAPPDFLSAVAGHISSLALIAIADLEVSKYKAQIRTEGILERITEQLEIANVIAIDAGIARGDWGTDYIREDK